MTLFFLSVHREKKLSHFDLKSWVIVAELKFDLKSWVTGGTKIRLGKVGNWRKFESIWLSVLSQFDSQCWVNLTLNVEPIGLSMLSHFDFQCWVNLTLNVETIWLKYSTVTHFAGSNFSSANDSNFYVKMT